jgi:hypothetical protein
MLLQVDNSDEILISAAEAQRCLGLVIAGLGPEWHTAWKLDSQTSAFILGPLKGSYRNLPPEQYDPWLNGRKGLGGGLSLDKESVNKARARILKEKEAESPAENKPANNEGVWLYPGRRVRLYDLVNSAELNDTKGTLVEEVAAGTWHVLLDGGADRLVNVRNMKTLAGVPLDVASDDIANEEKQETSQTAKEMDTTAASGQASLAYSLAGTWTDWNPEDMQWDATQECFTLDVRLRSSGGFGITRGKAGKKWKTQKQDWVIQGDGKYQIRLFVNDSGRVKKVDWIVPGSLQAASKPLSKAESPGPESSADGKGSIAQASPDTSKDVNRVELPATVPEKPKLLSPPPYSYCLAGRWMDWVPQDMVWNPEQQCFLLNVYLEASGGFGICRGKAGARWRSKKEEWTIRGAGHYDIKLFIKESGAIKKVDWVKLAK